MKTDATLLANNSQNCWMLHVTSVCTPCCMLLGVVGSCCAKFEIEPPTPNISFVPWSPKLAQQCWIRLHSSANINDWGNARAFYMVLFGVYKILWVVFFPWCAAGLWIPLAWDRGAGSQASIPLPIRFARSLNWFTRRSFHVYVTKGIRFGRFLRIQFQSNWDISLKPLRLKGHNWPDTTLHFLPWKIGIGWNYDSFSFISSCCLWIASAASLLSRKLLLSFSCSKGMVWFNSFSSLSSVSPLSERGPPCSSQTCLIFAPYRSQ